MNNFAESVVEQAALVWQESMRHVNATELVSTSYVR